MPRSKGGASIATRSDRPSVAVVTEIVAPYRIPVFNELARLLEGRLHVYFIAESERRRGDWPVIRDAIEFEHTVLGGLQASLPYRGDRLPLYLSRPLLPRLRRERFDTVVVGGWNHLECYQALLYARRSRVRFVFWSETPLFDRQLDSRPARNAVKRAVVQRADGFVTPGVSGARYLKALGAAPGSIHIAPNAVDNDFWSERPADATDPTVPTVLFVGRLIEIKGIRVAVEAFRRSQLASVGRLVVVGDGPERAAVGRLAPANVSLLGPQQMTALRRLYHSSTALVFPSNWEVWGVVVNEAAAAGLPTIGSDRAAAVRDQIEDEVDGLVFPAGDVDALARIFDRVATDPESLVRLRPGARALAERASPRACAEGIAAALVGTSSGRTS